MEKIIEDLEKDLRNIIEGKPLGVLREGLKDSVDIRALRMVNFALQWVSVGYQSALRLAGMKLGRRMGQGSGKSELSLVLEEIKKIIEGLRGGKVEIEIIPNLKNANLKICESALSGGAANILQNLCFFEEGFIEGYLDGVISKNGPMAVIGGEVSISNTKVEEKRCVGLGDDCCVFLISYQ